MPRSDYKTCRGCGRPTAECGNLSHTRLCRDCAVARLEENLDGLVRKSGPAFTRYRRAMVATWGGVLLDDVAASTHTSPDA